MKVGRVVSCPCHLSTSRRLNGKKKKLKKKKKVLTEEGSSTDSYTESSSTPKCKCRKKKAKKPTKPAVLRVPSVSGVENYPQKQPSGTVMPAFLPSTIADIQNLPTTSSTPKYVNVDLS